jgi:hypothetical protein
MPTFGWVEFFLNWDEPKKTEIDWKQKKKSESVIRILATLTNSETMSRNLQHKLVSYHAMMIVYYITI